MAWIEIENRKLIAAWWVLVVDQHVDGLVDLVQ